MGLRVLVVEDEAIIAMLLADLLADMGHVVCATIFSLADAWVAASAYTPDLLIVDLNLGEDSGMAAAAVLMAYRPMRCIYVSGDARALTDLGPDAVTMAKPYQRQHLEAAIARAIA